MKTCLFVIALIITSRSFASTLECQYTVLSQLENAAFDVKVMSKVITLEENRPQLIPLKGKITAKDMKLILDLSTDDVGGILTMTFVENFKGTVGSYTAKVIERTSTAVDFNQKNLHLSSSNYNTTLTLSCSR